MEALANLVEEDPLVRAAGRWRTLRKFAPALIEALQFRAARDKDPMLSALGLLHELNRTGKRRSAGGPCLRGSAGRDAARCAHHGGAA